MMFNNFDYSAGGVRLALPVLVILLIAPFAPGGIFSRRGRGAVVIAYCAFGIYAAAALAFVFLPLPADPAAFCAAAGRPEHFALVPFRWGRGVLLFMTDQGQRLTLQGFLHNEPFSQALGNIGLFIPLGVGLRLLFGLRFSTSFMIAFAASLGIEVAQGTGMLGLLPCSHRLGDLDDLILNVSGGSIGWLVAGALRPDGTAGAARRLVAFAIDLTLVEAALILVNAAAGPFRPGPYAIAFLAVAALLVVVPAAINGGITIGKAVVGIRVAARGGGLLPLWRTTLRYAVLFGVPTALALWPQVLLPPPTNTVTATKVLIFGGELVLMLSLGPLLMLVRRDGKGLHDLIAGSEHRPIGPPAGALPAV